MFFLLNSEMGYEWEFGSSEARGRPARRKRQVRGADKGKKSALEAGRLGVGY